MVSLKVDTKGYGGRKVAKSARVFTNDPNRKSFDLALVGEVHIIAEIVPKTVRLWGTPGEEIKAEAVITPTPDVPFEIVGAHADNAADFQFEFKKRKHQYVLSVRNTKKTAGRYWGRVYLETDLDGGPEITVTVYGNIYTTPDETLENKS